MANITESEQWDDGVYQLETTDPVQGGADGVDNLPHKALANRTTWLKAAIETVQNTISNLGSNFAALGGSATQRFKVANAVNDDEAVNKGLIKSHYVRVSLSDYVVLNDENVIYDKVYKNTGNAYDINTGKYTCPSDGVYNVTFGFLLSVEGGNNDILRFYLFTTGEMVYQKRIDSQDNHDDQTFYVSFNVDCVAGQEIWIKVSIDGDDSCKIGSYDYSPLTIAKVGEL
jgi:hypothetical protein